MEVKKMLSENQLIGLMSEAGMPCVADPGHEVVRLAHDMGIQVIPMHGPSSIMQALVAKDYGFAWCMLGFWRHQVMR